MGYYHALGYDGDKRRITSRRNGVDIYVDSNLDFDFHGRNFHYDRVQKIVVREVAKIAERMHLPNPSRVYSNSGLVFHWDLNRHDVDEVLKALADVFDEERFIQEVSQAVPSKERALGNRDKTD